MQQLTLTYEQWKQVHPSFRSVINRIPHVVVYDDGHLQLARVVFERPERAAASPRRCAGQLRLRGA